MRDFANSHRHAWLTRITVSAGAAMFFALILTFLSPFGTYRSGTADRLAYWTIQMATWLVLSLVTSWFLSRVSPTLRETPTRHRLLPLLTATVPMLAVTAAVNQAMLDWHPSLSELGELTLAVILIGGAHMLVSEWLISTFADQDVPDGQAPPSADETGTTPIDLEAPNAREEDLPDHHHSALISRLPPAVRADEIVCVKVEDHYVRVHAAQSSAMVLMRFSDALLGLERVPGLRVHRSWWVADGAVDTFRRLGRTAELTLLNGVTVPVSQPYLADATGCWGHLQRAA